MRPFVKYKPASIVALLLGVAAILALGSCTPLPAPSNERGQVNEQSIYEVLDPYGSWVDHPQFGEVWRPDVGSDWAPFSYGDWVWSDQGWLWSSYEPFGWLVYHYGNWYREPDYGWFWVPGDNWSAAPVAWTSYGDYVGWCPSAPAGATIPNPWDGGGLYYWNVVHADNFTHEDVGQYSLRSLPPRTVELMRPENRPPEVRSIDRNLKQPLVPVKVVREPNQVGKKTYYRAVMPDAEKKKAERHQPQTTHEKTQSGSVIQPRAKKTNTAETAKPEEKSKDKKVKTDEKQPGNAKDKNPDKTPEKNSSDTTKTNRRPESPWPHQ
jgi:hypothetical protein